MIKYIQMHQMWEMQLRIVIFLILFLISVFLSLVCMHFLCQCDSYLANAWLVTLSVYCRINFATCVIGRVFTLTYLTKKHYFDRSARSLAEYLLYKDTFE